MFLIWKKRKGSEKAPPSPGCSSSRHPSKGWDAVWRGFLKVRVPWPGIPFMFSKLTFLTFFSLVLASLFKASE